MKALIIIACIILIIVLLFHIPVLICLDYADGILTADLKYFFFRLHAEAGIYDGKFRLKLPEKKKKKPKKKNAVKEDKDNISESDEKSSPEEKSPEVKKERKKKMVPVSVEELEDKEKYPEFDDIDITYVKNEDEETDGSENEPEEPPAEKKFIDEKLEELDKKIQELEKKIDAVLFVWELCKKNLIKMLRSFRMEKVVTDITAAGSDAAKAAIKYGAVSWFVWNTIAKLQKYIVVKLRRVNIKCSFDEDDRSRARGSMVFKIIPSYIISNGFAIAFKILVNFKKIFPDGLGKSKSKAKKK